uniref:Leucine-rich repeat-containing N-terminal plant-type domain-containing protein n=1 Tax=Setaria italica TaxID=4555 RepID=K3ZLB2_SETIT
MFPNYASVFPVLLLLLLLPHATCSWFNFCLWKGISCSRKHPQRVTQLDLTDQRLTGYSVPRKPYTSLSSAPVK